ncbi:MAG TPA: radical SAM protein [Spirochaetota bacterium]|nr:radical SAM protein [Spirochaetota bacterium]
MKVLLTYLCNYEDRMDYHMSLMPVGVAAIGAFLEQKGHRVTIANFSKTGHRQAVKKIGDMAPDIAGISVFTHNRRESLKLVRALKKAHPRILVVIGGPHATFLADEILRRYPEIDYIIQGEGEEAFLRIINALEHDTPLLSKIVPQTPVGSLDTLPAPSGFSGPMIDVNINEEFKYIITSRGCPHHCSFCCSPQFWQRKVRFRSPDRIMKEVESLYRKHGIIYFSIRDDNFTLKKERVLEFSRLLQKSGVYMMWNCQSRVDTIDGEMVREMKRAGLEHIQFGVESGSERILAKYDKSITVEQIKKAAEVTRKAGAYLSIYLMTGMEGETAADTKKTISLIKSILPGDGIVSPVALYPGTKLYEDEKKKGNVRDDIWFRNQDPGIFLRGDSEVPRFMHDLLHQLRLIRERSWYREEDFRKHRAFMGKDCWVTGILEGDYYLDEEEYERAETSYLSVISMYPDNPWGHLRLGKLRFRNSNFPGSVESYTTVTTLVPAYYGGWLKLAESHIAAGDRTSAKHCIKEAYARNRFDIRIRNLRELLK